MAKNFSYHFMPATAADVLSGDILLVVSEHGAFCAPVAKVAPAEDADKVTIYVNAGLEQPIPMDMVKTVAVMVCH